MRDFRKFLSGDEKIFVTETIPERCSDKTCPNHNPHKLEAK
jgi:hypothetical protein